MLPRGEYTTTHDQRGEYMAYTHISLDIRCTRGCQYENNSLHLLQTDLTLALNARKKSSHSNNIINFSGKFSFYKKFSINGNCYVNINYLTLKEQIFLIFKATINNYSMASLIFPHQNGFRLGATIQH